MIKPTGWLFWWDNKIAHIIRNLLPDKNDSETGVKDLNYISYCGETASHYSNINFGPPEDKNNFCLKLCQKCKEKSASANIKNNEKEEEESKPICPKCGKRGDCRYQENGGVEYLDTYTFECGNCGFTEETSKDGGSPFYADWPTNCPYCGKTYREHK